MVTLPLWALFAIGFGSPVLAFAGVLLAQLVTRIGAKELGRRSKREETMRTLRWAAELAISTDDRLADLGVAQLETLLGSELLDDSEKAFVEAALVTVYADPEAELDALGADAEVIQFVPTGDARLPNDLEATVSSSAEAEDGGTEDG